MPDGQFEPGVSSDKGNKTGLHHHYAATENYSVVSGSLHPSPSNYLSSTSLSSNSFQSPSVYAAYSVPSSTHNNASLLTDQQYSGTNSHVLHEKHQPITYNAEIPLERNPVMHSLSSNANKLIGQLSPQGSTTGELKSISNPSFALQQEHQQQLQQQQLQQLQMIQHQQRYHHQQQLLSNLAMSSLQHMDGSQDKFSSYSKIVANASNMSLLSSFTESDVGGSRQADNRDTSEDCRAGLTKEQHYYRQPSTSRARSPSAWSDNDTVQSSASSDGSQPKKPYSPYETAVSRQSPEVHNKNSYNTLFQKVGMNFYNRRTEDTPDGSGSPNGLRADDLSRHGSEVRGDVKDSTCPDLSLETSIQDGAVFPRGGNQDYMEADDYSNRNRLKTYHCSLCTFTCRKQVDLINHVAVHPDDKPFHCTQCDYKGAKYHHLRNHILTHSERSLLACPQCDYKSYQRGALRVHMRRHSTEKRHGCPHCPYRTHFKGNLKLHLRVHTGEKPYACPVCEFRCTQSGSLKIHMRGHSGEKPYACELCDYRSKHKGNLVMHRRKHTGDKPYQCDKCSYKAAQRMGLTKHYKTVHSDAASVPSRESATISPGSIFRAPMLARTESALSNAFTGYAPPLFKNEDVQNLGGQWIDGSKPACQDDVRPPFEVKAEGSGVLYNRQALVPDACSADVTARAINMHDN